jgi:glycosyltransferase involved in cell wall biosynthesis
VRVSIIVATRNRAHAITGCLDSIAAALAHAAPLDAEIVVVDNGSHDATPAIVEQWASASPFPVRQLFEPRKGLSAARNCALRAAQGDLLAWTDDDCRLSREYVADLLRHDSSDTELVLRGGRVELGDPTDLPICIKTGDAAKRWHKTRYPQDKWRLCGALIGANMAMRRAVADKVGYFDERFGAGTSLPGGEELDYLYRAYLADIIIEYVPDMVIFHHHGRKTIPVGNSLMTNYVIGGGGLYAKYIFRDLGFCKTFYWTIKNALWETICGAKRDKEQVGLSSSQVLAYNMLGVVRYGVVSAQRLARDALDRKAQMVT